MIYLFLLSLASILIAARLSGRFHLVPLIMASPALFAILLAGLLAGWPALPLPMAALIAALLVASFVALSHLALRRRTRIRPAKPSKN